MCQPRKKRISQKGALENFLWNILYVFFSVSKCIVWWLALCGIAQDKLLWFWGIKTWHSHDCIGSLVSSKPPFHPILREDCSIFDPIAAFARWSKEKRFQGSDTVPHPGTGISNTQVGTDSTYIRLRTLLIVIQQYLRNWFCNFWSLCSHCLVFQNGTSFPFNHNALG